ncbi:MAG: aminoacyl-tRNA hydrolase [Acidiferrobacterales bacterium]
MAQGITLIVGLGNPGTEYAETRHNAGFRFIDALLAGTRLQLRDEQRFAARVGRLQIEECTVWLLAPTTFMNHSGEAVARFAHYYKIPPQEILVVHDELDLPLGVVRLKLGGGDGGHNGVHDVAQQLGSPDFARLRIGIGRPGPSDDATSYVLKKPPLAERELIDAAIKSARGCTADIVHGHYEKVMNVLHTDA